MTVLLVLVLAAVAVYLIVSYARRSVESVSHKETGVENTPDQNDEEKDNWEGFNFYSARMSPAQGRYRINYEDKRGLKTERDIEVKRVHEYKGEYAIDAHCLLRHAHRSFLNDRIRKAVNLYNNATVDNVALDAIAQYNNSGPGRAFAAINQEWAGVAILTFVGRADGQMRRAERAIIADYIKRHGTEDTLDDDALDAELDTAIKAIAVAEPNSKEFMRIINDLKAAGERDRLNDLLECAIKIVGTQGTVAPMEKAAVDLLKNSLL